MKSKQSILSSGRGFVWKTSRLLTAVFIVSLSGCAREELVVPDTEEVVNSSDYMLPNVTVWGNEPNGGTFYLGDGLGGGAYSSYGSYGTGTGSVNGTGGGGGGIGGSSSSSDGGNFSPSAGGNYGKTLRVRTQGYNTVEARIELDTDAHELSKLAIVLSGITQFKTLIQVGDGVITRYDAPHDVYFFNVGIQLTYGNGTASNGIKTLYGWVSPRRNTGALWIEE